MSRSTSHAPVVVVGAGPVGLVAALALRRLGADVLVLESGQPDRVRPGSRAIGLFAPTLWRLNEVLPGLGDDIAAAGVRVPGYDTYYGGRRVFHVPARLLKRGGTSLPQQDTERIVAAAAVEHGVRFRWNAPVADVVTDERGATVVLGCGERIDASYVIGADGAHSAVRKAIGVRMAGHTDDTPFIIVDVGDHPDGSTPTLAGMFHYRCPEVGGRNVMHMPFAGGMRVDLQCLPDDDADRLAGPDGIREWMSAVLDPWYADHVQWVSTYRFHQLVADSYTDRHHRVLLAGEAAHLFAPWGGRGLNSGVIDATDAARAVADALAANDPATARAAITRCATSRRRWGTRNRDMSSHALRMLKGTDPVMRARRELAARTAPWFPPAGAWLASGPIQPTLPQPGSLDLY